METVINQELQLAFDFVQYTNRNIFLTGKAGTGKTTFLHELKKSSPKRMIVVAPTGVAAINARGVTIHSFFQLPFHPYAPTFYLKENNPGNQPEQKDPPGYKMSREKINIIKSLDLLVIDEISMVRADTLDAVDSALRRYKNRYLPFGGVQLLMIGDLQQLAPVVKDEDREIIDKYYDSPFFFGSRALCSTDYVTIELNHIYRQNDQVFIGLLNKVRDNHVDSDVLSELNKRYIPDFDPDSDGGYITLTTHNNQAQMLNDSKLEKLPGRSHSFEATIKDEFPEYSYPTASELILKKGAQVMFVKNDLSRDKLFFNGKIGKITAFEDDIIVVKCPDDDFHIRVEKAEWQNMKFTLDEETKEIQETVIGTFTQYPLKLAWAITIHKSQGLTFDRAVIDARAAFAHGQVYVALSRCRTLNGLVLSTKIHQRSIIDDPTISDFVNDTKQNQPDQKQLEESKKAYQKMLLTELFDFNPLIRNFNYCLKIVNEHHDNILGNLKEMLENASGSIKTDLIEVYGKFTPQLNGLLNKGPDAESNIPLQERIIKASEFFSAKLEEAMKEILIGFSVETDNKTVRKSVTEALERTRKEGVTKLACLNAVKSGFVVSKYLDARAKSAIDISVIKSRPSKPVDDTSGIIQHPDLFNLLKEWRNNKARELKLPHYMILPQKTMVTLVNFLPQSLPALKLVKGLGKKKTEKYGEELLNIIISYSKEGNIEPPAETITEKETPKKIKEDTKKISYDLYKEGKTVTQIAEERNLNETTIEGHLAHYVGIGDLPVNEFVSPELTDLIISHFEDTDDLKTGPVKVALGDKASWSDIKFVASHLKFLRKFKDNTHQESDK
ncbi:MAG TPA: helix-turn-helix domain-containing protein [Bacteroidales bacterium]|nr:helix-turn-helix domain-containing protein [Bacteroidales bacterium]